MKYRMELHCHTDYSFDGFTSEEQLLKACKQKNINVVAVSEHDRITDICSGKFMENGISVIPSCEFTSDRGAHVIGLFIKRGIPAGVSIADIYRCILEQGGVVLLPHPFKPCSGVLALYNDYENLLKNTSLIELFNGGYRNSESQSREIKRLAEKYDLKMIAASDSHKVDQIGYYVTEFDIDVKDVKHLLLNYQGDLLIDDSYRRTPRNLNVAQKTVFYQILVKKVPYWIKRPLKLQIYKNRYANYRAREGNYSLLRI